MKTLLTCSILLCMAFGAFSQSKPLPYFTGFDSPAEKAGWKEYRRGFISSSGWGTTTQLSHDYNVGGNPTDTVIDWMVSPPLRFTGAGAISFKVMTGGFSSPTPDNCQVWFSKNKADPATGNYVYVGSLSNMEPKYVWLDTTISLPFTADSGYIAFTYKTIGAAWATYSIDSISVTATATGAGHEQKPLTIQASVFPDPFQHSAILQLSKPVSDGTFILYRGNGQQVKNINSFSGDRLLIERGDLDAGIYFYEVRTEKSRTIGKLMIAD